jgi:uncharacterized membrane protein YgcG
VNTTANLAFGIAVGLILFGGITGWLQYRGLHRLAARAHVPSDERTYLQGRHRRRMTTGVLLVIIGGLIGGAYPSGLEPRIDALTKKDPAAEPAPGEEPQPKREMTDDEKRLVRLWVGYWIVVLVLVFVVIGLAFADAVATRRYALSQFQLIREDHQAKLRRDLAVYRAQKEANRGGRSGNRMGGGEGG